MIAGKFLRVSVSISTISTTWSQSCFASIMFEFQNTDTEMFKCQLQASKSKSQYLIKDASAWGALRGTLKSSETKQTKPLLRRGKAQNMMQCQHTVYTSVSVNNKYGIVRM